MSSVAGAEPGSGAGGRRVEQAGPRRRGGLLNLGAGDWVLEHGLEWHLATVANNPDRPGSGYPTLQAMAFSAFFAGDGHSHYPTSVDPELLQAGVQPV